MIWKFILYSREEELACCIFFPSTQEHFVVSTPRQQSWSYLLDIDVQIWSWTAFIFFFSFTTTQNYTKAISFNLLISNTNTWELTNLLQLWLLVLLLIVKKLQLPSLENNYITDYRYVSLRRLEFFWLISICLDNNTF